jgi:hypothetical protein
VAAALVLAVLLGGVSWITFSLRDDAAAMIEKLPGRRTQDCGTIWSWRAPTGRPRIPEHAGEQPTRYRARPPTPAPSWERA